LFFGARSHGELPYFGPLQEVSEDVLEKHLVFSRLPGVAKEYVQDRMRGQALELGPLLASPLTHIFICGLKGMEAGVDAAFAEIAAAHGMDWSSLKPVMRGQGRYHVETY
jgi:benzoyl-CoA 2,3-dioxygenase component A